MSALRQLGLMNFYWICSYICICLSIVSILLFKRCLSAWLSVCQSTCMYIYSMSTCPSVCLSFVFMSRRIFFRSSSCLSASPSSDFPTDCLFPFCLSVHISILSVCSTSIPTSVYKATYQSVCLSAFCVSVYLYLFCVSDLIPLH